MAAERERFERAAEFMRNATSLRLSNDQKLQLYGYFKQANEGKCNGAKPGFFDFTGRAKWEAWNSLGDMSREEAVSRYLSTVTTLAPDWESSSPVSNKQGKTEGERGRGGGGGGGGGGVGPVVSRMADREEIVAEEEKTVFDWCKEGRDDLLQNHLSTDNINERDTEGMTLLHWACDRGHLNIVQLLVARGANINIQDGEDQTPLHYASSCDQVDVLAFLLSHGADPSIRDSDNLTPQEVAGDPNTKQLFQSFTD